jgi:hypothetical protein
VTTKAQVRTCSGDGRKTVGSAHRLSPRWFEPNTCHRIKPQLRACASIALATYQGSGVRKTSAKGWFWRIRRSARCVTVPGRLEAVGSGEYTERFRSLSCRAWVQRQRRARSPLTANRVQSAGLDGRARWPAQVCHSGWDAGGWQGLLDMLAEDSRSAERTGVFVLEGGGRPWPAPVRSPWSRSLRARSASQPNTRTTHA